MLRSSLPCLPSRLVSPCAHSPAPSHPHPTSNKPPWRSIFVSLCCVRFPRPSRRPDPALSRIENTFPSPLAALPLLACTVPPSPSQPWPGGSLCPPPPRPPRSHARLPALAAGGNGGAAPPAWRRTVPACVPPCCRAPCAAQPACHAGRAHAPVPPQPSHSLLTACPDLLALSWAANEHTLPACAPCCSTCRLPVCSPVTRVEAAAGQLA